MAIKEGCEHTKNKKTAHEKENVDYFAYISDDLLLNILILLPHKMLQEIVMYVCKRWFNLITQNIFFGHASLIIQKPTNGNNRAYTSRLVSICEGRKKLRVSDKELDIPCKGIIRSWCNELLLIIDPNKLGALYVYNLITKEGLHLPLSGSLLCKGHIRCRCSLSLAFNKYMRVYKVVHVYIGLNRIECEVLKFKYELSDYSFSKWATVKGPIWRGEREYYWDDPVCVEGRYLHWDVHSPKYIVSMDIIKGEFRKTLLPKKTCFNLSNGYHLMEISGLLSVVVPFSGSVFEVWVLMDFEKSEWENLLTVRDSSSLSSEIRSSGGKLSLIPIASLKNGSNLIFKRSCNNPGLYAYKVFEVANMSKIDIQIEANERCVVQSKDGRWMVRLDE